MDAFDASALIIQYRYWILIPLSFVEGPVVAFIAGTLATIGYFNMYALAAIFFIRDIGLDIIYYAVGFYGANTVFARRLLKKIGLTSVHFDHIRKLWERHPFRTMLIGKLSYGIATAFIVLAGTVKMPFMKFLRYGALVAITQYWALLILGFMLGNTFRDFVERIISTLEYALLGLAVLMTIYYIVSFRMRKEFLKEEKQAELQEE